MARTKRAWLVKAYWHDGRTTARNYMTQAAASHRGQRWMEPWEGQPGYSEPRPGAVRVEISSAPIGEYRVEFEFGADTPVVDRTDVAAIEEWLTTGLTNTPGMRRVDHDD